MRAILFDATYDRFRGVVCNIAVLDGVIHAGDRVACYATGKQYTVMECGILYPDPVPAPCVYAGQVYTYK